MYKVKLRTGGSGLDVNLKILVEASHAKVMQSAAIKSNPPLPFSHTFGLNMAF